MDENDFDVELPAGAAGSEAASWPARCRRRSGTGGERLSMELLRDPDSDAVVAAVIHVPSWDLRIVSGRESENDIRTVVGVVGLPGYGGYCWTTLDQLLL